MVIRPGRAPIRSSGGAYRAAIAFLRSLGTSAHVWAPGANGVSVASLPSNNFLLSNGSTGYSGVDSVDGLTLDAFNGGASTQTARFDGTQTHYYTVKGANTLLAGDIEIICQAALTSWQTANQTFASSDNLAGNVGFLFCVDSSGNPMFRYSPDGTATRTATCAAKFSTVFSASANGYARVTYNSTTGDVKFYTSPDGTTWTQLGSTVALTAGTVFNGTGGIAVGAQYSATTTAIAGSITRLRVYRDLVGTIAVDFNPTSYALGSTSWVSAVGETWTFGSSTASTILPSGTHLTQPTTANKPLVRRGMLNLITQSASPNNAAWTKIGTAAAPNSTTVNLPAVNDGIYDAVTVSAAAGSIWTSAFVLSGTGTTTIGVIRTAGGNYEEVLSAITLTATPTLYAVTLTLVGAQTALAPMIVRKTAQTATTVTFDGGGLFAGTWTAAQILAEGGIPPTTATAASNPSAGKYWWSFNGSNNSLLSGNLGITNACTIVISLRVNSLAATQIIFAEDTNGAQVSIATNGAVSLTKVGGAALVTTAAGVVVAGVPLVLTVRLSAGTADIRKNGAQSATAASALTFSAVTGARVGTAFDGTTSPTNGALGWVVPLPTALSDADCLTVERLVSSQFPNGPVF